MGRKSGEASEFSPHGKLIPVEGEGYWMTCRLALLQETSAIMSHGARISVSLLGLPSGCTQCRFKKNKNLSSYYSASSVKKK
jgi:hypothetical protein